jgi:5-methylcytosine-specific restriction endonuclease McrA
MNPGRICRHGELVPAGDSCARCRAEARAYDRRRGTPAERGYDGHYQRLRRQVLGEESVCWLCGLPPRAGDPLTVDHVVSLKFGGLNVRCNLHAAHASCNYGRGARLPEGGTGRGVNKDPAPTQSPGRRAL